MLKNLTKVTLLLSVLYTPAVLAECKFFEGLSHYQKEVAYKAYRAGYPYDLGLTMVAIAWKESKLGLYKVRWGYTDYDKSVGVMHTVVYWRTKDMSPFNAGRWVQNVVENDIVSVNYGLEDLLMWKQRKEGDYKKMLGSYNGGFNSNMDYAKEVISIVRELKDCDL